MRDLNIAMTLLVRNEGDIIADNIRFHHSQGVGRFIVMDNLSTDRTADMVRKLSGKFDIQYIRQTQDDFNQSAWVTDMARRAVEDGADWVINSDADEFWVADGGDLRSFLGGIHPDIGMVEVVRHNAVVSPRQGSWTSASCHPRSDAVFEQISLNSLGEPLLPKVIHRASRDVVVAQGNHSVTGVPGALAKPEGIRILHYPYRSLAQYRDKIRDGGAAYLRNVHVPEEVGKTWRELHRLADGGAVDRFWQELVSPREVVTIDLAMQILFRDARVLEQLRAIEHRRRDKMIQAELADLRLKSGILVKEFLRGVAQHVAQYEPSVRPTRPMYFYLEYCFSGPNRHLEELASLHPPGSHGDLCKSFSRLRDVLSLFPRNRHMKAFLGTLLSLYFPEAVRRLHADCAGKRVMLHVCCRSRMERAKASIASFGNAPDHHHHILLVGRERFQSEDQTELAFEYDGQVLAVPIADNYESLHRKIFYALTLLDLVAEPGMVLKLDDDICLSDRPAFEALLEEIVSQGVEYAGRRVGTMTHGDQWHGWHVSKCEDPLVDGRGYQYPLPRDYAAGGFGYCLGPKGLAACSYMYLAMKEFFAMRSVGLEDVYVGHALYAQNIALHDITAGGSLMTMRGLTTGDRAD